MQLWVQATFPGEPKWEGALLVVNEVRLSLSLKIRIRECQMKGSDRLIACTKQGKQSGNKT